MFFKVISGVGLFYFKGLFGIMFVIDSRLLKEIQALNMTLID